MAVQAAKKAHFAASIASSSGHPAELFWVVRGLLTPSPANGALAPLRTHSDLFALHFDDKSACLHSKLDTVVSVAPVEVSDATIRLVF